MRAADDTRAPAFVIRRVASGTYRECTPPVEELEASFVGYVNGTSR